MNITNLLACILYTLLLSVLYVIGWIIDLLFALDIKLGFYDKYLEEI